MSIRRVLTCISPRVLFGANLLLWGCTFYRLIVTENKLSLGIWPFPLAVPGIAASCYLGLYLLEHPTSKGDEIVGYLVSYSFFVVGVLGVLGF
jgi:hypothetical protein